MPRALGAQAAHIAVADHDAAFGQMLQPCNAAPQGGFTTARSADDRQLSGWNRFWDLHVEKDIVLNMGNSKCQTNMACPRNTPSKPCNRKPCNRKPCNRALMRTPPRQR